MKPLFSFTLVLSLFTLSIPQFIATSDFRNVEETCMDDAFQPGSKVWVWDGKTARLTSKGEKKLADLKKKIKDKKQLKSMITAADFEYYCCYVMQENSGRCPGGCPGFSKQQYVAYSKVCNKPNYCPNVPGL
jgi:hypothetical protein